MESPSSKVSSPGNLAWQERQPALFTHCLCQHRAGHWGQRGTFGATPLEVRMSCFSGSANICLRYAEVAVPQKIWEITFSKPLGRCQFGEGCLQGCGRCPGGQRQFWGWVGTLEVIGCCEKSTKGFTSSWGASGSTILTSLGDGNPGNCCLLKENHLCQGKQHLCKSFHPKLNFFQLDLWCWRKGNMKRVGVCQRPLQRRLTANTKPLGFSALLLGAACLLQMHKQSFLPFTSFTTFDAIHSNST